MAKQFNFAVVVDREQLQPLVISEGINAVSRISTARSAKELRDQMREAYEDSVSNGSDYQSNPYYTSHPSLSNFIVMRKVGGIGKDSAYEVGAQKDRVVGNAYVADILFYMDQGTGDPDGGELWAFPLSGARAGNSENGFWVTRGQEPKEFMESVARNFGLNKFNTSELQKDALMVEAMAKNPFLANIKFGNQSRGGGEL